MEWDDNRREFVRRDRQWDRYADPRDDERGRESRGDDRELRGREPGMRERMRDLGDRARSMMDRDRDRDHDGDRERGAFTSRVSYEDWRRSADRGEGLRGRSEDWQDRDRGSWHAEPTRHPEAARRWSTRDDDRGEGWFARDRDDDRGRGNRDDRLSWARELGRDDRGWNDHSGRPDDIRPGGWNDDDRRDFRGGTYTRDHGLSDVPRWNGRDFAPRHDEYRTDWRSDRSDWRGDDRHERGFFSKMKDKLTGRPPKTYRRSDDRIREDLCDRLMQSWIDAEDVDVQVKDGEVTLTGTVRRREEKRGLEDLAEGILGVRDVNNHVKVRRDVNERVGTEGTLGTSTTAASTTTRATNTGVNAGMGFGQDLTPGATDARTTAAGPQTGTLRSDGRVTTLTQDGGTARTPEGTTPANGTTRRT